VCAQLSQRAPFHMCCDAAHSQFVVFFFFFSSRRRHTRYIGDWSSTCALPIWDDDQGIDALLKVLDTGLGNAAAAGALELERSEERRGGKEGRARWSPRHY